MFLYHETCMYNKKVHIHIIMYYMYIYISSTYWVPNKLPQIYTANHVTFPIQIRKITYRFAAIFGSPSMMIILPLIYVLHKIVNVTPYYGILLGDPEVTPNIYCKSRNLPNTDTQNYSTDLR